jgi:hypothetical protein
LRTWASRSLLRRTHGQKTLRSNALLCRRRRHHGRASARRAETAWNVRSRGTSPPRLLTMTEGDEELESLERLASLFRHHMLHI